MKVLVECRRANLADRATGCRANGSGDWIGTGVERLLTAGGERYRADLRRCVGCDETNPRIKEAERYLRLHLRTETVGLLRFRPDPVWLASPQLEAAFRFYLLEPLTIPKRGVRFL